MCAPPPRHRRGSSPSPEGDILAAQPAHRKRRAAGLQASNVSGSPDTRTAIRRMSDEELELTLVTKVAAAQSAGLDVHIVTQFCFEPQAILRWIEWLRRRGTASSRRDRARGADEPHELVELRHAVAGFAPRQKRSRGAAASSSMSSTRSRPTRSFARSSKRFPTMPLGELKPHFYSFGGLGPDGALGLWRDARRAHARQGGGLSGRAAGGEGIVSSPAERSEGASRYARSWTCAEDWPAHPWLVAVRSKA